jgi:hypothetical protein
MNDTEPAETTTATAIPADDATGIVTQAGVQLDQLAYSEEKPGDADTEGPVSQPWREAWASSAVIVFIAALVAFVVAVIGWVSTHTDEHNVPSLPTVTTSTLPAVMLPPLTAAPPPATSTVTVQAAPPPSDPDVVPPRADPRDEEFLQRVAATGEVIVTDRTAAVAGAKTACRELDHGETYAQIVAEIQRRMSPPLTAAGVHDYIAAVTGTYCPRYTNMLDDTPVN